MKILVTGASGLLGGNVIPCAVARGCEVVAACHREVFRFRIAETVQGDLTDSAWVNRLLYDTAPDWVLHAAALTHVDYCEAHPSEAMRVNGEAPGDLAKAAAAVNARFIQISTDAVFDGKRGGYDESDCPAPINVYARSKLAGEEAVVAAHPRALVVRTNFYGWNLQAKLSLAEWVLSKLESGQTVDGFEDVFFSPLLVNDLADVLIAMMERNLSGVYHVVGHEACSKFAFARSLAEVFGYDPNRVRPVSVSQSALSAPRPGNMTLQVGKVEAALGHTMPSLMEGLHRFKRLRDEGYMEALKAACVMG